MESGRKLLRGCVMDDITELSLDELCRAASVGPDWVVALVDEGILDPGGSRPQWRFSGSSLRRVRRVWRLQQDLGVNLAGAALALELLDEIELLRSRLNRF